MLTRQNILQTIGLHRERLTSLGVRRLGLFGSFVRDESDAGSDIDLLVEFDADQKTFDHFMDVSFLLEDLFQRRVELVTIESLSPYIGPHILKEAEYVDLAA